MSLECPHCAEKLPEPVPGWAQPWQCSHCGKLYGIGERGPFRVTIDKPLWPLYSIWEVQNFGYYAGQAWYVYAICYCNGLPFYVGKGRGQRACQHVKESMSRSPNVQRRFHEKHRVLQDLQVAYGPNQGELYHLFGLFNDEAEAYALEASLIFRWGLRRNGGMLCNSVKPKPLELVELPERPLMINGWNIHTELVYHPKIDPANIGPILTKTCSVCAGQVKVPESVMLQNVQCPHCAHYFKPFTGKILELMKQFNTDGALEDQERGS